MSSRFFIVAVLGLFASAPGFAQDEWPAGSECESLSKIEIPADDRPDEATAKSLAGCASEQLYYGFGQSPDFTRARQCAYLERDDKANGQVFSGAAILMMIYANGQGVTANRDLALRFACEVEGAPAEIEGRLAHLKDYTPDAKTPFDICDDITSGFMMGMCSDLGERQRQVARAAELEALLAAWPAAHREAFAKLRERANAFFDVRSDLEVDQSGTARGAMMISERATLEEDFLQDLQHFEQGVLPEGNADSFARADAELNAQYARARKAAKAEGEEFSMLGTITPEGIRDVERAWLPYRDAWVSFGATRYPKVSADAWREHFTSKRATMLAELAGEPEE